LNDLLFLSGEIGIELRFKTVFNPFLLVLITLLGESYYDAAWTALKAMSWSNFCF